MDPVVAADGHTYERRAITRWLTTSNKSPKTGSVLFHNELVPNYGLMSSIQEVIAREKEDSTSPGIKRVQNSDDNPCYTADTQNQSHKELPHEIDSQS